MNVIAIASRPRTRTGPPFERLYAVEPDGVEQIIPSHGHDAEILAADRPAELDHPPERRARGHDVVDGGEAWRRRAAPRASAARSCGTRRRRRARGRTSSRSGAIAARKPTRPKLTPITGMPRPSSRASVRRIVPSPPSATASCGALGVVHELDARALGDRVAPAATASPTSTRPCATTAAVSTGECVRRSARRGHREASAARRARGGGRTPGCPSGPGAPSLRRRDARPPRRAPPPRPRGGRGAARRRRERRLPSPRRRGPPRTAA